MKQIGNVKWFKLTKCYRFVAPEAISKDVFIHKSALETAGLNNLEENQKIEFEIEEKQGKKSATNIKLIN